MRLDRKSIWFRVVFPILIVNAVILSLILLTADKIADRFAREYHAVFASHHTAELRGILENAVTELTSARLLDQEVVVPVKKKTVLQEVASYWERNGFEGIITDEAGVEIFSFLTVVNPDMLSPYVARDRFYVRVNDTGMLGFAVELPAWGWRVVTMAKTSAVSESESAVRLLVPMMTIGFLLIMGSVFFILHRVLGRPIGRMETELREGGNVARTGITELDAIGTAINDVFGKITGKTDQYEALHEIAVSLLDYGSSEEFLDQVIDRAGQLLRAKLAAIVLYDERGRFQHLITRGADVAPGSKLPEGRGILQFMQLSLTPVRIDDLTSHPAFSGSFPEGHPAVRNLLGYPVFSGEGKPVGALYFGNKPGGFTEEDEHFIKAISADVAIGLQKAESIATLQKFRQVIESAFDVIIITDREGNIIYANPSFERVSGYSIEEARGKKTNILKSGYHDEGFYRNLWETITAGSVWTGEFINRKKNEELYHASAVIFPIRTDGELQYASIQRDITHEKKLYEQLLRAQKMEAIGTLAGGIAHDFNNLLTAVLGYSEILLDSSPEGDRVNKAARIINDAALKGAELAKKILLASRKEKAEVRPVDMNDVIRSSLELLERSIAKNIEISVTLRDAVPVTLADSSQMQQVIMNLAVNAQDAMPDGGKLVIETDVVGTEDGAANGIPADRGEFIKLTVSDTGTGMSMDTQTKIFEPFFTTKDTGKGTGLGLYIVHSIISNHGGYINVYSEPGRGTRFNIYLPVKGGVSGDATPIDDDLSGSATVLVIDDETGVRSLCQDLLEPLGFRVLTAAGGREGIEIFRKRKEEISLVILDMIMPEMGGREVFQTLRALNADASILLCSGYSSEGFAGINDLLRSGAKGFIQKPFTRQTLAAAIRSALTK